MADKLDLMASAARYLADRDRLLQKVRTSPAFQATGLSIYPHDSIGANLPRITRLFENAGDPRFLETNRIERVLDIGGANGDIALVLALAGYEVAMIDLTLPWGCGPLVASLLNAELGANLRIIDLDVDRHFTCRDLETNTVNAGQYEHSSARQDFDLAICTGLLYHLKNPYAFLESVRNLAKYVILGTWVMSYLPDNRTKVDDKSLAYFLDFDELNNDSSNYWIFTDNAFHKLAKRCHFSVLASLRIFGREDRISNAVDIAYGEQEFLLLQRA